MSMRAGLSSKGFSCVASVDQIVLLESVHLCELNLHRVSSLHLSVPLYPFCVLPSVESPFVKLTQAMAAVDAEFEIEVVCAVSAASQAY